MPSFRQVLSATLDAFRNRREQIEEGSSQILEALRSGLRGPASDSIPGSGGPAGVRVTLEREGKDTLEHAARFLAGRFDPTHGGFGPAPKFPQPTTLEFLLRHFHHSGSAESLEMVLHTLRAMGRGGMRDHLEGGFHRYSVDDRWLVPHFEKMLYDNGLLARVYLHAFQISGDGEFRDLAASTLDYVLSDLTDPLGGFYSARDADSEGEEGLFYLWKPEEVKEVLGHDEAALFNRAYDVSEVGNFEGSNILHLPKGLNALAQAEGVPTEELEARLSRGRQALLARRAGREAPFRDEKVLVAWNSYVLRALAEAGVVLDRPDYLAAARANASFLLASLVEGERLRRSWKDGVAKISAFLEDYAGLGNALLTLHEATLEPEWLDAARQLAEQVREHFWEEADGTFYDAPNDGETLVMRPRDPMDNATPSGNSLAVELLLRSARLWEDEGYETVALRALSREMEPMKRFPSAFGRLLSVLSLALKPPVEVSLLGDPNDPSLRTLLRTAHALYIPTRVVVGGDPSTLPEIPMLEGREPVEGGVTAYVCREYACTPPIQDPMELAEQLDLEARKSQS
jgi:uncharacterized protein YyaL (SSP411 family)